LASEDPKTTEESRRLVEANRKIFKLSGQLKLSLPLYKWVSTPKWRALVEAEDFFYSRALQLVDDAVLRMRDKLEANALGEEDFYILSYLMSKEELSAKDVAVICLSLFSDGLSTTTPTVLFCLYCLAANPSVQEELYKEVVDVARHKALTADALTRMPYAWAFVKETFRLFPNGTEVSRYVKRDLVLSGYTVPAGTHLDLNPSVHFRDAYFFKEPDQHRPERWLRSGDATTGVHPYLLTPFGHGTRMCAGRRLAEQDMIVLLSTLLRRFRLEYPVGESMGSVYNTLLFPDRPVRVMFKDRQETKGEKN